MTIQQERDVKKMLDPQDKDGHGLVTCFEEASTIMKEAIPAECDDEMYAIDLYAYFGPHFILVGTKSLDSSSANPICPQSLAFSTLTIQIGKKQIVSPYMEDFEDLPKHHLGVAALADILKAEENAEAIDEASYDMLNNNCVHYASSIWRRLGFDETEALGNFVVHNIVIDEDLLEVLESGNQDCPHASTKASKSQHPKVAKQEKVPSHLKPNVAKQEEQEVEGCSLALSQMKGIESL